MSLIKKQWIGIALSALVLPPFISLGHCDLTVQLDCSEADSISCTEGESYIQQAMHSVFPREKVQVALSAPSEAIYDAISYSISLHRSTRSDESIIEVRIIRHSATTSSEVLPVVESTQLPKDSSKQSDTIVNTIEHAIVKTYLPRYDGFPKKGIVFTDIFPALANADVFQWVIKQFADRYRDIPLAGIVGLDARGFVLGAALAHELRIGFIPIRKKGKLPGATVSESFSKSYGDDEQEISVDLIKPGMPVILIDDIISTGGSLNASQKLLIDHLGANLVETLSFIEIVNFHGRDRLRGPVFSILQFENPALGPM